MPQVIELPGSGPVEFPDGMTDDQIVSAIKKMSAPSIMDRVGRVAGLGARSLITGATAIPTLLAEGVAAPLRALTGGKYFPSPSATLQRTMTEAGLPEPANAVERLSTNVTSALAGGGATQAIAGAAQPLSMAGQGIREALLQQPARQLAAAGTGATSSTVAGELGAGPIGQTVAGIAGSMLPFAPQMVRGMPKPETQQVRESVVNARDAGYVLPPSQAEPNLINKTLGGFSGQARTEQAASLKNQTVTNSLARKAIGVGDDIPLNQATLDRVRNEAAAPYREIAGISSSAKQYLDDLRTARSDASAYYKAYGRTAHPEDLKKAQGFLEEATRLESLIESFAKALNRPKLVEELRASRAKIAKTYDIENALNVDTGNVDARILGRARDRRAPLSGELKQIGSFANAFDRAAQSPDGKTPPFISPIDAAVSTAPLIASAMSGNPWIAGLAAIPFLRPPTRSLILSDPYQALMATPNLAPLARPDAAALGLLNSAYQ
jgi:hypothetical protein